MQEAAVRAVQMRLRRGKRVVFEGLDLHLPPGVTGILGPNGAGKTTLLRALATVVGPDGGSLSLLGVDVRRREVLRALRRQLAYLPQVVRAVGGFDVRSFLRYMALLKEVPSDLMEERVHGALGAVDLAQQSRARMRTLSGGQLRRAGIAQALVNRPRLLLLDEPTAGLDPAQRIRFRELVTDTASDSASVVISTHLVEDVASICSHVVVVREGSVMFSGSREELTASSDAGGPQALEASYARLVGGYGW